MTAIAPVITIDGPSGAGKGTLCKAMAEALQWHLLDSGAIYRVLALAALHHHVDVASEDALVPLAQPIQAQQITELPREVHKKGDHGGAARFDARPLLAPALQGQDVGLISEAGMPAVADPGSSVVRAAHDLGITVVPLVGPVSILLALAASGLNGQNFAFVGYLPQDAAARTQRVRELEALAHKTGQTQLFIETPYRNPAVWQALLQALRPATRLAVAQGLTLADGRVQARAVNAWRQARTDDNALGRAPAVFAIGP